MVRESRESNESRSGSVVFSSDDSGTSEELISIRKDATLSVDNLTISVESSGSDDARVELYDSPEGTPSDDLEDQLASYVIAPGEFEDLSNRSFKDVEDDLMVVVDDNDSDVHITCDGHIITG